MDTVIQELEWSLEGSDKEIKRRWEDVEQATKSLIYSEERVKKATEEYARAVAYKDEARQALEILRAAQ